MVLEKTDTKNLLEAVKMNKVLSNIKAPNIGSIVSKISDALSSKNTTSSGDNIYRFDKLVIDAPNLKSADGLKEAIYNLPNLVPQFARK